MSGRPVWIPDAALTRGRQVAIRNARVAVLVEVRGVALARLSLLVLHLPLARLILALVGKRSCTEHQQARNSRHCSLLNHLRLLRIGLIQRSAGPTRRLVRQQAVSAMSGHWRDVEAEAQRLN